MAQQNDKFGYPSVKHGSDPALLAAQQMATSQQSSPLQRLIVVEDQLQYAQDQVEYFITHPALDKAGHPTILPSHNNSIVPPSKVVGTFRRWISVPPTQPKKIHKNAIINEEKREKVRKCARYCAEKFPACMKSTPAWAEEIERRWSEVFPGEICATLQPGTVEKLLLREREQLLK